MTGSRQGCPTQPPPSSHPHHSAFCIPPPIPRLTLFHFYHHPLPISPPRPSPSAPTPGLAKHPRTGTLHTTRRRNSSRCLHLFRPRNLHPADLRNRGLAQAHPLPITAAGSRLLAAAKEPHPSSWAAAPRNTRRGFLRLHCRTSTPPSSHIALAHTQTLGALPPYVSGARDCLRRQPASRLTQAIERAAAPDPRTPSLAPVLWCGREAREARRPRTCPFGVSTRLRQQQQQQQQQYCAAPRCWTVQWAQPASQ